MAEEDEIHRNKRTDKTYISRRLGEKNPLTGEVRPLRIASKVLDDGSYAYAKEKGEVVLRHTPKRRKEIVAKFLEDDRHVHLLTLQSFDGNTGNAHKTHFTFLAHEVPKIWEFLSVIENYQFDGDEKVNITDEELRRLVISQHQAKVLVRDNEDVFTEVLRSSLTKEDVVTLGYRKRQIQRFEALLSDEEVFSLAQESQGKKGAEPVWQAFFEANTWIFGYGLSYLYVSSFDNGKLERVVRGHDVQHTGKVVDGLMRSRGVISALCFVEIKTHKTPLLDKEYRSGCWSPSSELVGAIAQVQTAVNAALESLGRRFQPKDASGAPLPYEIFNVRPKAFIVIGHLSQLLAEHGVHEDKYRSFEQFRNSIQGIEILTFDELYERSRFIVTTSA